LKKQKGRASARPFQWKWSLVPVHPWSTATIARSRSLKLFRSHLAGPVVASDFESNLLAFLQIPHPSPFDGGDVYEHILAAVIGLNEAETLGGIKPFYCAGGHENPPFGKTCRSPTECPASSERFRKGVLSESRQNAKITTAVQAISMKTNLVQIDAKFNLFFGISVFFL
jgi:hypothetical protein